MWVTLAGQPQLLIVSAKRMMGLSGEDGSLLWDFPWITDYDVNVAQAILLGQDRVFISAGYGHGRGCGAGRTDFHGFLRPAPCGRIAA